MEIGLELRRHDFEQLRSDFPHLRACLWASKKAQFGERDDGVVSCLQLDVFSMKRRGLMASLVYTPITTNIYTTV